MLLAVCGEVVYCVSVISEKVRPCGLSVKLGGHPTLPTPHTLLVQAARL